MLEHLKKLLESEKKDKTIFDIVIYESAPRIDSKPNDIDIAEIFLEGNLRDRLDKIQDIKSSIKKLDYKIDIKQMLLKELFSTEFLARTGIILEGESVFSKKKFSEKLGMRAFTLFCYNLENLNHTQKVKFNYILSGRNSEGMLKRTDAIRISSGVVKIPIARKNTFAMILKENKVPYSEKNILEEL